MSKKQRITIEGVRARVQEMSGIKIATCYLKSEKHWGYCDYWLVFTDPDIHDRVHFERIQDVNNWLDALENRAKPPSDEKPSR